MVDFDKMDKLIDKLVEKINQHKISSISIEENGIRVEVKRENGVAKVVSDAHAAHGDPAAAPSAPAAAPSAANEDDGLVAITSPMVGTFYRSPSPDSPPFVDIGHTVKPGKTVCIVEAMKLFNEIESEAAGTIVKILVENGKPVEYGQKLMLLRP
ncbi:MAG: acetyl-CoA carboxylase biotin carboxyl carrier protein [Candidatus Margulisiibacteriota bacterium]